MSKEIDTQQTLFVEDSHANPSVLQEREREQMMTATSGMKLLESSESVNLDGLLGKMLKELLTSKKAWSSDKCKMIWKKRVSKSNVLLFQLQASVRGIKEKEFGLLHTPTATEIGMRSKAAMEKRKKYRESIGRKTTPPGNLLEQIQMYPTPTQDSASERTKKYKQGGTPLTMAVKMYPTPTASDIEGGVAKDVQMKDGHFFRENKKGERWGVKLRDAMSMYSTPTASDYKDAAYNLITCKRQVTQQRLPIQVLKNNTHGGKLNPHFVEFLMAYPMNWTKVDQTE